jgi:hypothetical protein
MLNSWLARPGERELLSVEAGQASGGRLKVRRPSLAVKQNQSPSAPSSSGRLRGSKSLSGLGLCL